MTYKILFLDIDGTILKNDHTYTESTKDAINQLKQKGIQIFLCTGRPTHELGSLAEALEIDSLIGSNGSHAIYQNKTIFKKPYNPETIKQFIDIAKEHDHKLIFYTSERNYHTDFDNHLVQGFINTFQLYENEPYSEDIIESIVGAHVLNVEPADASLYEFDGDALLAQVNFDGYRNCYDVVRKTVNKGAAVKHVLAKLNIPAEQAIAFGDAMNDKEMLQIVGESFAMGNANPNLFQYAKHKTTTVENSGIYNGLKKLGLVN